MAEGPWVRVSQSAKPSGIVWAWTSIRMRAACYLGGTLLGMQTVSLDSDGLRLSGVLHEPPGAGKHPAFLLLHGFGGTRNGTGNLLAADLLTWLGYAALRF